MSDNEWTHDGGIWSLKSPNGQTLIQIKHDGDQYVVAQYGGRGLGKVWDDAARLAESIADGKRSVAKRKAAR